MDEDIRFDAYGDVAGSVSEGDIAGFFVGWPQAPSSALLLATLAGSQCSFVARSPDGRVVGIAAATDDGVLSAHISLLEVLPNFQRRGIGSRLLELTLGQLEGRYMVDLCCDADLVPFYRRFGMRELRAMGVRRPGAIPSA